MKTIRISDEVWDHIAQHGKFGETADDVLRRMFGLNKSVSIVPKKDYAKLPSQARYRMRASVSNGLLKIEFETGAHKSWSLPSQSEKSAIRKITHEAMEYAEENGASLGQINAVRKALTDAGYRITQP